jgi:hypothetical protein
VTRRLFLLLALIAAPIVVALGSMLAGRYYYGSLAQPAITSGMMHAVHLRLTMRRFTLLLASALVVVFSGAACVVGHFAYVGFASRSLNKCLVLPWLSDLVAT